MNSKSILLSKTFWFNVAAILLALMEAQEIINVFPPHWLKYFTAVIAAINIVFRTITRQPVEARLPRRTPMGLR